MKLTVFKSTALALIVSSPMTVMAAEPLQRSEASNNPVQAIATIPIVGVKMAMGVAAIPLLIVGEIGNLSGQAGETLWQEASRPMGEPIPAADTKTATNSNERFYQ